MANELTVTGADFELTAFTEGDMAEAIAEEMDGLGSISFDRIKIPSGGGIAFEVPGEDEDSPVSATELVGIILCHHPVNAYWADKFSGGNEPPTCSARDGKTGTNAETGEIIDCSTCPHNQFGSDGAGKACKNMHRVYMLLKGSALPVILSLPPTSLKPFRDYLGKKIIGKGMRSFAAITRVTLKKDVSAAGIKYSKAAFAFAGRLTKEETAQAKKLAEAIKQIDQHVDIVDEDYNTAPQPVPSAVGEGFMDVPGSVDDAGLSFN